VSVLYQYSRTAVLDPAVSRKLFLMPQERSSEFGAFGACAPRIDVDRFAKFDLWCQLLCSRARVQ